MISSAEAQYFQGGYPLTHRDSNKVAEGSVHDSLEGGVPPRYRDGLGGIDLEQVRRDQRKARQQVVQAMIQRLGQRPRRQ